MRAHAETTAVRAEPNVTPMIDVMLVLLVIFMLIVPALTDGFQAVPPSAAYARKAVPDESEHTIGIDARGRLYFDRRPIVASELPLLLAKAYQPNAGGRVLYVVADRAVDYASVQDAVSAAAAAGVRIVGLVTEKSAESGNR
jgi:biopolymer transport protein ExbD